MKTFLTALAVALLLLAATGDVRADAYPTSYRGYWASYADYQVRYLSVDLRWEDMAGPCTHKVRLIEYRHGVALYDVPVGISVFQCGGDQTHDSRSGKS